jgi:hypothetical protein
MNALGIRHVTRLRNDTYQYVIAFLCGCTALHADDGRVRLELRYLCGHEHDRRPELWANAPMHPRAGTTSGPP